MLAQLRKFLRFLMESDATRYDTEARYAPEYTEALRRDDTP